MATATREEIRIGGLAIRFVAEAKETGGALAMFEFDVAAGARVPAAHSHDAYDETVYGLAGVLTLTVEGARSEVGPGDALFIPRGAVHRFDNLGGGDVRALAVVTPGLLGPAYFREVAEVLRAAAGGPPDLGALAAVMRRHGLTPAPPPPAA
jgi:quercetin dioxygenase-like cupin family protein